MFLSSTDFLNHFLDVDKFIIFIAANLLIFLFVVVILTSVLSIPI